MFYNSSVYEKEKDERIRNFLHFVHTNDSGKDDFSSRLSEMVEKLKANEKFRGDYLAMNLHDRDIMERARQEGTQQKAVEDAVMLVQKYNVTPEEAAKDMGAPLELVLEELNKVMV